MGLFYYNLKSIFVVDFPLTSLFSRMCNPFTQQRCADDLYQ